MSKLNGIRFVEIMCPKLLINNICYRLISTGLEMFMFIYKQHEWINDVVIRDNSLLFFAFLLVLQSYRIKTDVINDPLGQIQSLPSSEHSFRMKFVLFRKVGPDWRTDERTACEKQWSLPAVTVGRPRGSKLGMQILQVLLK